MCSSAPTPKFEALCLLPFSYIFNFFWEGERASSYWEGGKLYTQESHGGSSLIKHVTWGHTSGFEHYLGSCEEQSQNQSISQSNLTGLKVPSMVFIVHTTSSYSDRNDLAFLHWFENEKGKKETKPTISNSMFTSTSRKRKWTASKS